MSPLGIATVWTLRPSVVLSADDAFEILSETMPMRQGSQAKRDVRNVASGGYMPAQGGRWLPQGIVESHHSRRVGGGRLQREGRVQPRRQHALAAPDSDRIHEQVQLVD